MQYKTSCKWHIILLTVATRVYYYIALYFGHSALANATVSSCVMKHSYLLSSATLCWALLQLVTELGNHILTLKAHYVSSKKIQHIIYPNFYKIAHFSSITFVELQFYVLKLLFIKKVLIFYWGGTEIIVYFYIEGKNGFRVLIYV